MLKFLYILIFSLISSFSHGTFAEDRYYSAILCGEAETYRDGDTLVLRLSDRNAITGYDINRKLIAKEFVSVIRNGSFRFDLGFRDQVIRFTLTKKGDRGKIIDHFLLEPQDSIYISVRPNRLTFSGKGVDKFTCRQMMDSIIMAKSNWASKMYKNTNGSHLDKTETLFLTSEVITKSVLMTLENFQKTLSPQIFKILKADAIGKTQYSTLSNIRFFLSNGNLDFHSEQVKDSLLHFIDRYSVEANDLPESVLAMSRDYFLFIKDKLLLEERLKEDDPKAPSWVLIKDRFHGPLRDKLLTHLILLSDKYYLESDSLIADALITVKNPVYLDIMNKIQEDLYSNKMAYNFTLKDANGNDVSLSDFLGKVVFIDFWFTGCGPCKFYYANTIAPLKDYFETNKVVVFVSISIDRDREKWLKSIEDGIYTSPKAINLYSGGKKGYTQSIIQNFHVSSYPAPFLIGKDGIIITNKVELLSGDKLKHTIETALE